MASDQRKNADPVNRDQRQKRSIYFILSMMIIGVPLLLNALGKPRIQAMHVIDIVQLIGLGFMFGMGIGALTSIRAFRREFSMTGHSPTNEVRGPSSD